MTWEIVVGLEIHVQLATRSKLFCGCSTAFGGAPNTNVCPVCLGLPGALPVPNEGAVRLGARAAMALGCEVRNRSVFARKNYFYPDLPKGYQISQFDEPLAVGGGVDFESPERGRVRVGITRLHLEEDAGKSLHDRIAGATAVDLNRAGVPLAEIVTEPDVRSGSEARAFLTDLRQRLRYAGVSDCSMEKGSLRVDANISLRRPGTVALGRKTEVKNMNSFANVERAIGAEAARQAALLEAGGVVEQVTLLFDAATGQVRPMRSKEESHDYRYFPDPDLPPLGLATAWLDEIRTGLPEMPPERRARLESVLGLPAYDAGVLTAEPEVADYFEAVVAAGADPKPGANWVMGEVLAAFNESGRFAVAPDRLADLIGLVADGTVSLQAARRVFGELPGTAEPPRALALRLGLVQVRDAAALESWVAEVVAAHPDEVARYRAGESKLLGFLVGQVMKRSRGKADPKAVNELLLRSLT
ncbi:MAG: Asp-tRNA(Asn)/Glu-tRNA(Gln) amidotransferase subunit GatB [Gemmatimonadales bacterium]